MSTPTTETAKPTTTDVPANVLRDALSAALVAVGTEGFLPVLNAVQIEKSGDALIFRATDRYRLVRVTITLDTPAEGDWVTLLTAADCKQIIAALPRKGLYPATLGPDGDRFAVSVLDGASLRVTPLDGDFPKTDQIIPTSSEATDQIAFNPKYLADVVKLPGRGAKDPVVFTLSGPVKPAWSEWTNGVSVYVYVLMPIRIEG